MATVAIWKRFVEWLRDPPEPSGNGFAVLVVYTGVVLFAVPFLAPLGNIFWWVLIGGNHDPQFSHLARFDFITFTVPFLTLIGLVGVWMSWYRRRGPATVVFAALPVVAGVLAYQVADGFRPPPPPPLVDEPSLAFSGGDESRRPFDLRNERYTVRWSVAVRPGEASCRVDVRLRRVATGFVYSGPLVLQRLDPRRLPTASGEEPYYKIDAPGLHDLVIVEDSGCDWSVTLTPGWSSPTRPPAR